MHWYQVVKIFIEFYCATVEIICNTLETKKKTAKGLEDETRTEVFFRLNKKCSKQVKGDYIHWMNRHGSPTEVRQIFTMRYVGEKKNNQDMTEEFTEH